MATKTDQPLGIEFQLWAAADKLRGSMDASEYKHVVLGLLFLKYISDAFEELHGQLETEPPPDRAFIKTRSAHSLLYAGIAGHYKQITEFHASLLTQPPADQSCRPPLMLYPSRDNLSILKPLKKVPG